MNLQNGLENVRGCNEWNTFFEEKIKKETSNLLVKGENSKKSAIPRSLNEVVGKDATRISTRVIRIRQSIRRRTSKRFTNTTRRRTWNWKINFNFTIMRKSTRRWKSIICIRRRICRTDKIKS